MQIISNQTVESNRPPISPAEMERLSLAIASGRIVTDSAIRRQLEQLAHGTLGALRFADLQAGGLTDSLRERILDLWFDLANHLDMEAVK